MTLTQQLLLIAHVLLGLLGVIASYACWLQLSGKHYSVRWLTKTGLIGVVSYWLAWLSGGYYYVTYYGGAVKPIIKAGSFPWAHTIVMESKEHVFLVLPFLSILLMVTLYYSRQQSLETNLPLRSALRWIAGTSTVLGTGVALAGFIISGAVR